MDQLKNYADDRLLNGCVYCRGRVETREHVPSRIFIDEPYPENIPVIGACRACNNGFSLDEEYIACIVESIISNSTEPLEIRRPKIAVILKNSPSLRSRIESSKIFNGEKIIFQIEEDRFKRILLKLARGHLAYELAQECRDEPALISWQPLELLSDDALDDYNAPHFIQIFGEIGSRGMQRLNIMQATLLSPSGQAITVNLIINDWINVQEGRYRYQVISNSDSVCVKIVIGEYFACNVLWRN